MINQPTKISYASILKKQNVTEAATNAPILPSSQTHKEQWPCLGTVQPKKKEVGYLAEQTCVKIHMETIPSLREAAAMHGVKLGSLPPNPYWNRFGEILDKWPTHRTCRATGFAELQQFLSLIPQNFD